ncbi:unnamed protein product, partial [Didymodactylos carnosus]
MSTVFPHLEKLSLVELDHNQLAAFLDTLHDLNHLVEIHLYHLSPITEDYRPTILRTLLQANDNQLTSILLDDLSSCLSVNGTDRYLNILQLRINMRRVTDLPSLFAAVPSVRYLDVILVEDDDVPGQLGEINVSPLLYLTDFRLKSIRRCWTLEELLILLGSLPIVQEFSLYLSTDDQRFVD